VNKANPNTATWQKVSDVFGFKVRGVTPGLSKKESTTVPLKGVRLRGG
jgi:hypothetical protein